MNNFQASPHSFKDMQHRSSLTITGADIFLSLFGEQVCLHEIYDRHWSTMSTNYAITHQPLPRDPKVCSQLLFRLAGASSTASTIRCINRILFISFSILPTVQSASFIAPSSFSIPVKQASPFMHSSAFSAFIRSRRAVRKNPSLNAKSPSCSFSINHLPYTCEHPDGRKRESP